MYLDIITEELTKLNKQKPESTEVLEFLDEQMETCLRNLFLVLPFDTKNYWNTLYLVLNDVKKKIEKEIGG